MTMASTQRGIFAKMTTNKQSSPLSAILSPSTIGLFNVAQDTYGRGR